MLSIAHVLCSKLKGKKYKRNSLLKSYKNEIKILGNPGLVSDRALNNPAQDSL